MKTKEEIEILITQYRSDLKDIESAILIGVSIGKVDLNSIKVKTILETKIDVLLWVLGEKGLSLNNKAVVGIDNIIKLITSSKKEMFSNE